MNDNQTMDAAIREGIDACRPESDDLRQPELTAVAREISQTPAAFQRYARVQQCDRVVRSVMHDVAVPADLAGRILAQLAATQLDSSQQDAAVSLAGPPVRTPSRRWSWVSMVLAASMLIAGAGIAAWTMRARGPLDVATLAEVWYPDLSDGWQPISKAPRGFAMPEGLAAPPLGWQAVQAYQGYRGVAYELSRPGRPRAVLFVVQVVPGGTLPKAPPQVPQFSSGGRAVAAWLSGKRMCVLVVEGDERTYRSLVRTAQPLA